MAVMMDCKVEVYIYYYIDEVSHGWVIDIWRDNQIIESKLVSR